jgi:hypothetical protein
MIVSHGPLRANSPGSPSWTVGARRQGIDHDQQLLYAIAASLLQDLQLRSG